MTLSFPVRPQQQGWLLRDVLRSCGVSSTMIRAVKRDAGFFLDGLGVHTDVRVQAGQQVSFALPQEPASDVQPQPIPLQVCYCSEHTLVLDKPAGMAVHPTLNYKEGTLANGYCFLAAQKGWNGVFRPLNRLDRDTSGLVLCAQNAFAAPLLAQQVHKVYYAVVQGRMPLGSGRVDAPIDRAPGSIIQRCVSPQGKPSRTDYQVLAADGDHSLLRLVLATGRTHQIRVHMASIGHPLAGDDLYGGSRQWIGRHALHCGSLTFTEPLGGGVHRTVSGLPRDLCALAARMGLSEANLAELDPTLMGAEVLPG